MKTATTGLLVEWELDAEPLPATGEQFVVIDSADAPVALIEMDAVHVVALVDVDIAVAHDEGEGFATVADWRRDHEAFWNGYVDDLRARLDDPSWSVVDETPILVERFRLVRRLDDT